MRAIMTAIFSLACLGLGCESGSGRRPELRADAPAGWQVSYALAGDGVAMKLLAPKPADGVTTFGVICRSAADVSPEKAFRTAIAQVKEIGGEVIVGEFDRARQRFVLTYTLDTVARSAGQIAVKADSAGHGRTLIISGSWPAARQSEMVAVFAAFAASVDFR